MADNAGRVATMAGILSIMHIIVGSLLICFGIADSAVGFYDTGHIGYGIWIGVWMCIAGGLGIPGTRKERSTSRDVFAGIFMGFSITSAVLGGVIIIAYSIAIVTSRDEYNYHYDYDPYYDDYGPTDDYYYNEHRRMRHTFNVHLALSGVILILGIAEFGIGIWAAVCLCIIKPCTCCYDNPQQGQVMYPPNSGYCMAQYPGGAPLTIPMQGGSGMVPVQTVTPGSQEGQPQMVAVPVSGMVGNQTQFAQIATSGATETTGFQPQFAQVATPGAMATTYQPQAPPAYRRGGYTKLENEDFPVNA